MAHVQIRISPVKQGGRSDRESLPALEHVKAASVYDADSPIFIAPDNALIESADVQLIGELEAEDVVSGQDVPVRLLSEFTIYDKESKALVHIAALLHLAGENGLDSGVDYSASGLVRPWTDEDEDEEVGQEDDPEDDIQLAEQCLMLDEILDVNMYNFEDHELDTKIWLKTRYAWYILDMPSATYIPFYADFYKKHHVVCLVLSVALSDPRTTWTAFMDNVKAGQYVGFDPLFSLILGNPLTPADLELDDVKSYLLGCLIDLKDTYGMKTKLAQSLLIKEFQHALQGTQAALSAGLKGYPAHTSAPKTLSTNQHPKASVKTVVTPTIHKIARPHFLQHFIAVGPSLAQDLELDGEHSVQPEHYTNPSWICWLEPGEEKGHYKSVNADGDIFCAGDIVAVPPGHDEDCIRQMHAAAAPAQCENLIANSMWFCEIQYFYQCGPDKMFHARWLEHGSKTILEELADPSCLFYVNECDDLKVACIFTKEMEISQQDGISYDEQRLVKTDKVLELKSSQVAGHCYVVHPDALELDVTLDDWLTYDDHFFVMEVLDSDQRVNMPVEDFQTCGACYQDQLVSMQQHKALLARNQPLQALELFSGAGGLSVGLHSTPYIQTRWAVELSQTPALTYQKNHPGTMVYNMSTNDLLQKTLDAHENQHAFDPTSLQGLMQPMPVPGEVDLIYGGPPCQSFSGANYNKVPDDPRSALIANFMSWVDYYRPRYFLIENVVGMLNHRLKACKVNNQTVGGIQMGIVKFIMRAATTLGYQVHCKVLQAAEYGSPQSRERIIFIGARGLTPLPRFPIPTHCFPRRVRQRSTVTGNSITGVNRLPDYPDIGRAPFAQVTVNDATSDLPPYDWVNPHKTIPATRKDECEVMSREARGIKQFIAHDPDECGSTYPGYAEPVPYACRPKNGYQRWMREGMGDGKCEGHYTKFFRPIIVERVVNVPLRPIADHTNLPNALRGTTNNTGQSEKLKGLYARLDANGHFSTALTTVLPMRKPGGKVLHPTQKRVITVRECARAQGFPDNYVFVTEGKTANARVQDQLKQIGNAVPIPLGRALGMAIGESLMQVWKEQERRGSPEI
ncbi:S-adenosyl-L-methionine-dependent methyltransferase [Gloeophyllum trabeum ATCC 11539]|uniref:Cytosine-specific methyltransferase n=1 Tax=Gloeophyllum trabeum (strain ATCC 11539 / FP-39264 / Madison 617) TaxID=670483 RepID=S7QDG0_GLOTA|nr:S-adenosyl-L-methionine-dependent methyltransferase [Gloeophyllum trabeum ATCC 11539]EPQ57871.1 S-adenosyl-L-methionine-dependent methyltransferase [Gloeophyllum trabeum ATCC 11539]